MKKIVLLLSFFAFIQLAPAQITLEQNYPASATLSQLGLAGYKYYLMDVVNDQCRIYNMDHSLWKTIALAVPDTMYLYNIRYVSDTLFNKDSKVELAYTYYYYDTTYYYYTYYTRVIDEDGVELLSIPGCSFVDVVSTGKNGSKMLAYVYDYSLIYYTVNTLVYSLPGTLPPGGIDSHGNHYLGNAFPNPSSSSVTIHYTLPEGISSAEVILMDGKGAILKRYKVDNAFHELIIGVSDLPRGAYMYQLITSRGISGSGKIVRD